MIYMQEGTAIIYLYIYLVVSDMACFIHSVWCKDGKYPAFVVIAIYLLIGLSYNMPACMMHLCRHR